MDSQSNADDVARPRQMSDWGKRAASDWDSGRRASDAHEVPEDCDAAKAQSRYMPDRNNSLEQYERSIHPDRNRNAE